MSNLFENLNPEQIEAIKHLGGPALVVAGPGSGKTRVLTHRVAHLIKEHDVPAESILCVTFTNKAAGEIKERVNKLINEKSFKIPWSGTFHSTCAKILRKHGYKIGISPSFVIYDSQDQQSLVKGIIKDFGMDIKKFKPRSVLATISSNKSELITSSEFKNLAQGYYQKTVAKIYPEYQKRLRDNGALDFDDLLVETVRLFNTEEQTLEMFQNYFKYVLVDEYQDTNKAQYVLTRQFSDKHKNLFVVGDMAQAIYSFRGADYRNILNFQNDYEDAKIYNLEQNYRSTQNILSSAKNVIKNNATHIPLNLWTENGDGEKLLVYTGRNEKDEATFVANQILKRINEGASYKDLAVLYRTNAQSRNIEETLIRANIPYKIIGGLRFYARKEVKDIIAYLRLIHNPKDSVSWSRIINVPTRGIGKKGEEIIKESGWDLDLVEEKSKLPIKKWILEKGNYSTEELMENILYETDYIKWIDDGSDEASYRIENIKELKSVASQFVNLEEFLENVALIESSDKPNQENKNCVTLMTIHASKGLEFSTVFIVGMEEGLFPHARSQMDLHELEEERRLCYVAITRAMKKVIFTNAISRLYFGNTQSNMPSRFLSEIPQDHIEMKGNGFVQYKNTGNDNFLDDLDSSRANFNWE